jgi:hypothetical protein
MESLVGKFTPETPEFFPRKIFDDIFLGKKLSFKEFSHVNYPDYQSIFGNRKLVEVVNDEKFEDSKNFIHYNLKVYLNQKISYGFKKNEEISTLSNQFSKS